MFELSTNVLPLSSWTDEDWAVIAAPGEARLLVPTENPAAAQS